MNRDFLEQLDEYIARRHYRLINAVLVYENGNLAFERYYNKFKPDSRNQIKSIWKSILSLTLGVCINIGLIQNIDEPVSRYLAPFGEGRHPYHKRLTIRHLLTMSSGIYWSGGVHYHCPMMVQMRQSDDWVSYIADVQMADMPGVKFAYKEWDVILLSALIGKACEGSAWDICGEYLYKPLEINSEAWTRTRCGVSYPSWGDDVTSDLSAEDLAKIGLLMLSDGVWNGSTIMQRAYIDTSVAPSMANSEYGCLWWLSNSGYHGRGFGGQELNVYPGENVVTVIQAAVTASGKSYGDLSERIISDNASTFKR